MLALTLSLLLAAADEKPAVMVLYFDNNTGKSEYDVMKKGLADLLITDLIAYEGVTVVEREKLEAVLGELKLQRTKSFDPKTQQKMGKMVGARYALTGSMFAFEPNINIDARLIDLSTNKDVISARVTGPKDKFLELEQELIGKVTGKFELKLADANARKKMKGANVDVLLSYSKGLDFSDQGDLGAAQKQFEEASQKSPFFFLSREKIDALKKRQEEILKNRAETLSAEGNRLMELAVQAMKKDFGAASELEQKKILALRAIRVHLLIMSLRPHLVGANKLAAAVKRIAPGSEAKVNAIVKQALVEANALLPMLNAFKAGHKKQVPGYPGMSYVDPAIEWSPEEINALKKTELDMANPFVMPLGDAVLRALGSGSPSVGMIGVTIAPPPAALDSKNLDELLKLFNAEALAVCNDAGPSAMTVGMSALYFLAPTLAAAGRDEDAVRALQLVLDKCPPGGSDEQIKAEVKAALGMGTSQGSIPWGWQADWAEAMKTCAKPKGDIFRMAGEKLGHQRVLGLLKELDAACAEKNAKRDISAYSDMLDDIARELDAYKQCDQAKAVKIRACELEKGRECEKRAEYLLNCGTAI